MHPEIGSDNRVRGDNTEEVLPWQRYYNLDSLSRLITTAAIDMLEVPPRLFLEPGTAALLVLDLEASK